MLCFFFLIGTVIGIEREVSGNRQGDCRSPSEVTAGRMYLFVSVNFSYFVVLCLANGLCLHWLHEEPLQPQLNSAELALADDLAYIWIDTLCIDKSGSAELSEAINSMFNW